MKLLLHELLRHSRMLDADDLVLLKRAHIVVIEAPLAENVPHADANTGVDLLATSSAIGAVGRSLRGEDGLPFAPPFALCWMESMTNDGRIPLRFVGIEDAGTNTVVGPIGALVRETSPGVYDLKVVQMTGKVDRPLDEWRRGELAHIASRSIALIHYADVTTERMLNATGTLLILNDWMRLIHEGAMAVEHTHDVLMFPRGDGRKHKRSPHEIRRIVRIVPKTQRRDTVRPLTPTGIIDWSHRWEVRGHWRRVKGLGKDRAGDYVVRGFTWVRDFVKGPADLPLVTKTREFRQGAHA